MPLENQNAIFKKEVTVFLILILKFGKTKEHNLRQWKWITILRRWKLTQQRNWFYFDVCERSGDGVA